jgi:hypothetical protein
MIREIMESRLFESGSGQEVKRENDLDKLLQKLDLVDIPLLEHDEGELMNNSDISSFPITNFQNTKKIENSLISNKI